MKGDSMNLIKTLKSVLFISLILVSFASAQDNFTAIIKIDGRVCIAHSKAEYQILQTTVQMVNTLKKVKARKGIDEQAYNEKVVVLLEGARSMGVRINN
jgi:Skp family chaperone for outer membrane proteins